MALQLPASRGPSVDPTIAPTVRVRPSMDASSFGGGRGVDQAAGVARGLTGDLSEIAMREEMRAQEAQANEIDVELGKLELQSREQLYSVQGGGALEAQVKMLEDYDKASGEILKKATSARVRERVGSAAERRRIALEGTTNGYVRGQMLQFEEEQVNGKVRLARDRAAQVWSDPNGVALSLNEQAETLRRYGALSNKPKEWVDSKILEEGSAIHRTVITQMIRANKSGAAQEYLEANKEALTGADLLAVEGPLKMASLQQGALANADRIMNSGEREAVDLAAGKFITKEVGLDEALEKSKEIEDLELRKQTQHELIRLDALRKDARQAAYQVDVESAFSAVEKREKVPVEVLSRLKVTDRQSILSLERQIAKGDDRESDEDVHLAFHEQSPEEMAAMQPADLLTLKQKLSNKDYEQAKGLITSAKRDASKPDTRAAKLDFTEMRFRMDESGLGLEKLSKTEQKNKSMTAFEEAKKRARSSAFVEFRSALAAAGKPVPIPEQQALFDEIVKRKAGHLLLEFNVDDDAFDVIKRAGELQAEDFENDDWETPPEVTKRIDSLSKVSVPGWASMPTTEKTVRKNMAYVAIAQGQSDEFVADVLNGVRRWPW